MPTALSTAAIELAEIVFDHALDAVDYDVHNTEFTQRQTTYTHRPCRRRPSSLAPRPARKPSYVMNGAARTSTDARLHWPRQE
jgi:hypothetical protein